MTTVWLVGMPGSGKSTVGRALAGLLGAEFVDADEEVERRAGQEVAEIFAREGEEGFRRRESEVLGDLAARTGLVVSCGGGAVLDPGSREAMRRSGTVVLLEAPLDTLAARVTAEGGRPLVRAYTDLGDLEAARRSGYREAADVSVDATGSPEEVARLIAEALR